MRNRHFQSLLQYEKTIYNSDIDGIIETFELWMNEEIQNESNQPFITEAGDVEKWTGSAKSKMLENKEEALKYLRSLKKTNIYKEIYYGIRRIQME